MKTTKINKRVNWILENKEALVEAKKSTTCPVGCKSKCSNGATCAISSSGGWGFWVHAFRKAEITCGDMNYWSGSNPTPSTSINKAMAEYILGNVPEELL